MKEDKILTLALTETRKDQFNIIGYLYSANKFVSFDMKRYKNNGNYLIDIGAISKIFYNETQDNSEIKIVGDIVLEKYLTKLELNNFLFNNVTNFSNFKRNMSLRYAIVEVKHIEDLSIRYNNGVDTHLTVIVNGNKERIKLKDFRWINYWKYIIGLNDSLKLEERKNHYLKFFNDRKKYLILYRYKSECCVNTRFKVSSQVYWANSIFYV